MTNKPRAHAELIIAWANGADIQYRGHLDNQWKDSLDPAWAADYQYRVKPSRSYPETLLSPTDFDGIVGGKSWFEGCVKVANAVLRHAIDNGQVVTREEFDRAVAELKQGRQANPYFTAQSPLQSTFTEVV